jgi:hypothetical protein
VVGNVLDSFGDVDPSKLLVKSKLHLLVHTPDDTQRFGPLVRKSVETYESYNAIFRRSAILSNRQAVSRDTARKFRAMDCLKHFLSGGFYKLGDRWTQAGTSVRSLLHEQPILQRHLGWSSLKVEHPGNAKMNYTLYFTHFITKQVP